MEIDPSIRTHQVNYSNRPSYKHPRNFNIESNPQIEQNEDANQYFENLPYLTAEFHPETSFDRYSQEIEYQENDVIIQENLEDQAELNFLE